MRASGGLSVVPSSKSRLLTSLIGNKAFLCTKCSGIGRRFNLIWAAPIYLTFLRGHQCHSRIVRDFWGTLFSSVKQIKAPYLFHWEQGIALHAMQGNRALSLSEGEVSWFFSSSGGNLGQILELLQGEPLTTFVFSATSGLLSS